jgi:hypothetical protein
MAHVRNIDAEERDYVFQQLLREIKHPGSVCCDRGHIDYQPLDTLDETILLDITDAKGKEYVTPLELPPAPHILIH